MLRIRFRHSPSHCARSAAVGADERPGRRGRQRRATRAMYQIGAGFRVLAEPAAGKAAARPPASRSRRLRRGAPPEWTSRKGVPALGGTEAARKFISRSSPAAGNASETSVASPSPASLREILRRADTPLIAGCCRSIGDHPSTGWPGRASPENDSLRVAPRWPEGRFNPGAPGRRRSPYPPISANFYQI